MKKIRKSSKAAEIYNEGLVVFLYDKANGEIIKKEDPTILEAYGEDDANDPKLAGLAKSGILVVYELEQDDELSIEVATGAPLNEEELQTGRWHPMQRALINLPSGTLHIEGYNNLRLSPDYDPDEYPGAVIKVPPGDYVISLYTTDWEKLEEDGLWNDSQDWKGPGQVIVLTPAAEAEPVSNQAPMLHFVRGT